ncbi:carbohydrate-binding module family 18 protein [Piromyces sp. E2]|nr:carbohydrate-binding module family 18 protein [Piromyces sp. E2]|eukprot:OUM62470.1 carbohydrate-binding module family 18 protein [Piromyces sp. E2]
MKFNALILGILAITEVYASRCGKGIGKCSEGKCCSKYGLCGTSDIYCGNGCQSEFGACNVTTKIKMIKTTKTKKIESMKIKTIKIKTLTTKTKITKTKTTTVAETASLCKNSDLISCIKDIGINKLKKRYVLMERPVQQKYKELSVNGIGFEIKQYEIIGVGNLAMMGCDSPFFKMFTYILTPFYKNIPLFSSDYIIQGNKQDVINEIYSTVTNKNDTLYKIMSLCPLQDNQTDPGWFDEWRPAFANKSGSLNDTDVIASLFNRNINLLMELEQKTKFIDNVDTRVNKYNIVTEYVNSLVENGGVSTDMFKAALGVDQTREFFYTILFGNDCFKPSY